jgi:hypothetical protein
VHGQHKISVEMANFTWAGRFRAGPDSSTEAGRRPGAMPGMQSVGLRAISPRVGPDSGYRYYMKCRSGRKNTPTNETSLTELVRDQSPGTNVSKPAAWSYGYPDHWNSHDALGSLTWVEQIICGRLVLRQLNGGSRVQRELRKYGQAGTIRLCSARAFQILEFAFMVVAVALAALVQGTAGLVFLILGCIAAALGLIRAASAARTGTRWRSTNSGPSEE